MKEKRRWRCGSFTVEAAVVVPLTVFLIAALIGLTFLAHDRMWYTGAACEAALAANAAEDKEAAARRKIEQKKEERILPGAAPEAELDIRARGTAVTFSGQRELVFFVGQTGWQASVVVRQVRPAVDLRNWWALKNFGKEIAEWDT